MALAGGSTAAAAVVEATQLPEEVAWQGLDPWLEQLPPGETARLRNNMSMEGSSGFRRLTGQKAEPPWGVKFTLLGSGQDEMRAGFDWRGELQDEGGRERKVKLISITTSGGDPINFQHHISWGRIIGNLNVLINAKICSWPHTSLG